jgi:hypothetical protein
MINPLEAEVSPLLQNSLQVLRLRSELSGSAPNAPSSPCTQPVNQASLAWARDNVAFRPPPSSI